MTAAPGTYPVTVTVTDSSGGTGSTTFTIIVTKENADATYTGDMLAFTPPGGSHGERRPAGDDPRQRRDPGLGRHGAR